MNTEVVKALTPELDQRDLNLGAAVADRYLEEAGSFREVRSLDRSPRRLFTDPLYAVIGESAGPYAEGREAI